MTFLPATVVTEHPELAVRRQRGRGYPWRPFDQQPDDFFRGASSIDNVVEKPWLKGWAIKVACDVAAGKRTELAGLNKADATKLVKSLTYDATRDAANKGSTLHDYAANQLAAQAGIGFRTVDVGDDLDMYAATMTDWIDRHVTAVHAIERTLYVPRLRVAGTVDAIVQTAQGVYGIDWKTKYGKGLHEITPDIGHAMQAWALGNASHIATPETHTLHDLPQLDGFLVVYIGQDGHLTHPVDIRSTVLADLVAHSVATFDRLEQIGTSVFGPPVRHLTASTSAPAQVDMPDVA